MGMGMTSVPGVGGAIEEGEIADGSVTTGKLANSAVTVGKLATTAVDATLPWNISFSAIHSADVHINWINWFPGAIAYGGVRSSSAAQNDEVAWDLVLAAGTWDISIFSTTAPEKGIYTVSIDAVTVGTIDGYSAGAAGSVLGSITGIVVATTGKKRVKFKMTTKNASSSGYGGEINGVSLRRTV